MTDALTFGVGIPAPEPGYYVGVPAAVYHQWDACSNGRLQKIKRSPAHLWTAVVDGTAETDALRFGSAVHMAILEPELFAVRYAAKQRCTTFTGGGDGPQCQSMGKYLLASGEVVCGTHYRDQPLNDVVTLMDPADCAACGAMHDAVRRKRRAANLVGAAGDFELSIVWDEQVQITVGGRTFTVTVRCKARLDHYSPDLDRGTILDLKSALDAEEGAFTRALYRHGYHEQGALYTRGARALNLPAQHFVILAMEKSPPWEVGVFRLTEGALDAGEQLALKRLALYARCQYTGEWPGYEDRVRDISVPDWAWRAMDDELQQMEGAWQEEE